jgi:GR25 family glycosyltransferase involved in LPS biosynthesis
MNNPFDYFKEIYCINLDHRTDRWEHAQKEFEKISILNRVKRFSAIKHEDGRIGLIQSFLTIFKDVYERKIENVLIFEDDVTFINDPLINLEKALIQSDKKDWVLFYLGATMLQRCKLISPNLILLKDAYATQSVAYRFKIFKQIIDKLENTIEIKTVEDIFDVFLCNEIQNKQMSLMINPIITTQYSSYSDLEKKEINYDFIEKNFIRNVEN